VNEIKGPKNAGIGRVNWDLRYGAPESIKEHMETTTKELGETKIKLAGDPVSWVLGEDSSLSREACP
jgi:hypothetical protein